MKAKQTRAESTGVSPLRAYDTTPYSRHQVGELVRIDEHGRPWVTFSGSNGAAVAARSTLDAVQAAGGEATELEGRSVLLVFENGDPHCPIILSLLSDTLRSRAESAQSESADDEPRELVVNGKRLVLDGQEEVQIKCGKSSILLRRDGKILIRGTNLLSRSSGANKIKGGSISLN